MTDLFTKFVNNLKNHYNFNIIFKEKSLFMKLLSYILFFNKDFMIDYTTTIGNNIYFPNQKYIDRDNNYCISILAHEIVHIKQSERYGKLLFSLMYLFPQCLSLLSILSVLAIFWFPFIWCLVFLLFLAPLPAPWRTKFELEACTMSLYMIHLRMFHDSIPQDKIDTKLAMKAIKIDKYNFRGPDYWFMWPFGVLDKLEEKIELINKNKLIGENNSKNSVISASMDNVYDHVSKSYLAAISE